MDSSFGIASQRAPSTAWSVVILVHCMPAAISMQTPSMDELPMLHSSNITEAVPLSSAAATPCAPFNDETCLHSLYWGSGYSCASATEWCHSWGKDLQRCCSLACGTAYLTERACNQLVSAGTCAYPHSGSSSCEDPSPAPTPTPSPTNPPTSSVPFGGYGGYGGYGGVPTATPIPTSPPTSAVSSGGYGGYGGYGGAPTATPSPTSPPTPAVPSGGYGGYGGYSVAPTVTSGFQGAQAPAGAPVSATGDPHLRNVHGEEFDLMEPGKHVLIQIPRKPLMYTMLRVDAEVQTLGPQCADMYFQELNVTGTWADVERSGGFHYYAQSGNDKSSRWMHLGSVRLKVAHGRTREGTRYLNFYVRDLARTGFAVGGLLGDDDHSEAAMPPEECVHRLAL